VRCRHSRPGRGSASYPGRRSSAPASSA
jgi:hypothetical protein